MLCCIFPKWFNLPETVDRWEALIIVVVSVVSAILLGMRPKA